MLKNFGKYSFAFATALLIASCGSRDMHDMANSSKQNSIGTANVGHSHHGHDASQHNITPGSMDDYRKNIGDRVFFDTAEYILSSDAKNTLNQQANWLKKHAMNRTITIEGHADERGTREYNLALGARRAHSVRNYLASQGLPITAFNVVSFGKERPAVDGSDAQSWAKNRRAVVVPQ